MIRFTGVLMREYHKYCYLHSSNGTVKTMGVIYKVIEWINENYGKLKKNVSGYGKVI